MAKPTQIELKYRMFGGSEGDQGRPEEGSHSQLGIFDDRRSSAELSDIGASVSAFFLGGNEGDSDVNSAPSSRILDPAARKSLPFISAEYSPFACHVMFFLLKRRVMVFDLCVHRPIGSMSLERSRADFMQLLLCKECPETLFCLHEDGTCATFFFTHFFLAWRFHPRAIFLHFLFFSNSLRLSAWYQRPSSYTYDLQCFVELTPTNMQSRKKELEILSISAGPRIPEFVDGVKTKKQNSHFIAAVRTDGSLLMVKCVIFFFSNPLVSPFLFLYLFLALLFNLSRSPLVLTLLDTTSSPTYPPSSLSTGVSG
jgi:hypothetical protein